MFNFTGQVAVITGASSGLGVQFANALASRGASLALLARRLDKLEAVAKEISEKHGVKVEAIQCDITDTDNVHAAAQRVREAFGQVDILINNAGTGGVMPAIDMTDEEWDRDIQVDLTGTFRVTREFVRGMIEHSSYGRVINIASMYGMVGNMGLPSSAYHAAKGGVVNLTRALAAEWASKGVTVNCICPGYFETELTKATLETPEFKEYMARTVPLGRYGRAGELDSAVLFLASRESSYVSGVILPVDGGYTCV